MTAAFKICPMCNHAWRTRESFLSCRELVLTGYQANLGELRAGVFMFIHLAENCGTSLAITVDKFMDMHDGPVFEKRLTGSAQCPGHCIRQDSLDECHNKCECAFVRDIIQKVKNWPKSVRVRKTSADHSRNFANDPH